jgi:periplasmic protein TonB
MILPDYRHKLNNAETLRGINPQKFKNNSKIDLHCQYKMVFHYSVIVTLIITICLFRYFPDYRLEQLPVESIQEIIDIEQIDITRQEDRPPPPQRPPVVLEVEGDGLLDDLDILWGDMDLYDDAPPPRPPAGHEDDGDHYFVAVEQMPEIVGGIESIMRNLEYPELARRAGVEGVVFVIAYVDEEGIVQKVEIARGVGAGLDEAAMEAVAKARFIPGRQRGVPRKVVITIPIRFSLRAGLGI